MDLIKRPLQEGYKEGDPLDHLCRLCMKTHVMSTQIPIFKKSEDPFYNEIDNKILECISIQITQHDGLPSAICQKCATKVIEWYDFKLLAKSCDELLRRTLAIKQEHEDYAIDATCDVVNDDSSSEEDNVPLIQLAKTTPDTKIPIHKSRKVRKQQKIKSKPFCKLCGVKFLKFNELSEHCQEVHDAAVENVKQEEGADIDSADSAGIEQFQVYRCHVCGTEFGDRKKLRVHCKAEHNIKEIHPYACSHCPRQFPSWNPLVVHERQHTGTKPYSCDVCSKANFISLASLRRHKMMHDKVYHCEKCEKDFNCDSALKAHIRCKHTHEKPFLCTICGRSFSLAATLSAHMTSHSNERKYCCGICGFRSKTGGNHHRHMARHNKPQAKSFNCPTCGKAFETKLQLSSHIVIHKSDRPHVCQLCGKGFIYRNKMETHILLVHAKERPHPCKMCGRKLATKYGLKIHLKTHSKHEYGSIVKCEDEKPFNPPQLVLGVASAPVLTVSSGGNLVLEEVKAGLLCFKATS